MSTRTPAKAPVRAAVALLVALTALLGVAPAASAWMHPFTPDVQFHGNRTIRNYEIDVNATCRWQYGGNARSKMLGQSWRDWRCVVNGADRSVDFTGYCRATYHHGRSGIVVTATHRTTGSWTSTSWRCRQDSPGGRVA